ncbi:hypothetical protein [Vibrio penaeicida]|uniref:hypothetical protein n=1 Tax=Vibrio penaeicida TaxID=104609 RepID=UPI000CEA1234|nr:hypothetical protein [Vibrio penaeicida]
MSKNKWNLVIQEVGTHQAKVWVGTLSEYQGKPDTFKINVFTQPITERERQPIATYPIQKQDWELPFTKLRERFFKVVTITGLEPNQTYYVDFVRGEHTFSGSEDHSKTIQETVLETGTLKTLPTSLSETEPFVAMLGSCFYNGKHEKGQAAKAYTHLYFQGKPEEQPHVKFLTGDQVYLDIGVDSLSPVVNEVHRRIATDYAETWDINRKMYRHGGCWFLADDHEYWNNYPYVQGTNPYLWAITLSKKIKAAWTKSAKDGVKNVQQITPFRTFDIGDDLSFCFVDLRTDRDKREPPKSLTTSKVFEQLIDWAKRLDKVGVLVLPQPLIVKPGSESDYNLANYKSQYKQLLDALGETGNDILCLSGDVHYGRIASVEIGSKSATLHEVISSPMSNIPASDGGKFSAATPKRVKNLPRFSGHNEDVQYEDVWCTKSELVSKWYMLKNYYQNKEHFMTLAFTRSSTGNVKLEVQAWLVRHCERSGKPKKQFKDSRVITLKKRPA